MLTKIIGNRGEDAACRYLKKNGYRILERNYKKVQGKIVGEIDIIASKGETLSFVEVKTRKSEEFCLPCEAVTKSKQQKIIKTAYAYIEEKNVDANYSFDVIEVLYDRRNISEIRHLVSAFGL